MTYRIGLIIHDDDVVNVFLFDDERKMKRKIWIYPEGDIHYLNCETNERRVLVKEEKDKKKKNEVFI